MAKPIWLEPAHPLLAVLLIAALAGCGGDSGGTSAAVEPVEAEPTTLTELLTSGMYQVAYGAGELRQSGSPDHGISLTRLGNSVVNGDQIISAESYAGNWYATSAMADISFPVFTGTASTANDASMITTFNASTQHVSVWNNGMQTALASSWGVNWAIEDLSGKPINDYLANNPQTNPFDASAPVSGTFPVGAKGYRVSYVALQETYMQKSFTSTGVTDVTALSGCSYSDQGGGTAYRYLPNGTVEFYDGGSASPCNADISGLPSLGNGTWADVTKGDIRYIETVYPNGSMGPRIDPRFSAATYEAGVHAVNFWDPTTGIGAAPSGSFSVSGFVIPASFPLPATHLFLNKTAANAVRQATGM